MIDPAASPAAAQRAPSPVGPRPESDGPQAASTASERQDPLARRPDALRAVLVDPGPSSPPPESDQRSGLWLSAAVVVLAYVAAFVWFQPGRPPVLGPADPARPPPAGAAVEQAPAAPPPEQPAALPPAAPVLEPVAVTPEPTIPALMTRALDLQSDDPAAAAVAYARAALRGGARAAYYLGQLYETGTGVEPSPGLARLWYAAAANLPAAERRSEALSAAAGPQGAPASPVPIFQARLSTGGSEMIWDVPEGVTPVGFRVEIFGPAGKPLPAREATVPGVIVPFPVNAWRVIAIGADGAESAPSATVRMIPAEE